MGGCDWETRELSVAYALFVLNYLLIIQLSDPKILGISSDDLILFTALINELC